MNEMLWYLFSIDVDQEENSYEKLSLLVYFPSL